MKKSLLAVFFGLAFFVLPVMVFAQGVSTPSASTQTVTGQVTNPLGTINSFCGLIKAILGAAIQIGIPIAVLFIVFAGFKFVWARGNSEALITARQNLLWTVIGIGIFLGAWLLAMVIANTVNTISAGSGGQQAISCQ